jgi:hypothetical protein
MVGLVAKRRWRGRIRVGTGTGLRLRRKGNLSRLWKKIRIVNIRNINNTNANLLQ